MAQILQFSNKIKEFREEWEKPHRSLEKCGNMLQTLKNGLIAFNFLPTDSSMLPSKQELLLARDILEYGVQWSVEARDVIAFEQYMSMLKLYYFDYKDYLPESAYTYEHLGLNLLFLLSQNRLAEFHCEVERLNPNDLTENVYIKYPVNMEQYLMEGRYNSVFLAKGTIPAASYNFFLDILIPTMRDEIADCMEKAYENISIEGAAKLLFFSTKKEIIEYIEKKAWVTHGNRIYFSKEDKCSSENVLKPLQLTLNSLFYAKELEKIV